MKKNDVILFMSAILFSGLFYKQAEGINYLLFTLLVSITLLMLNPQKITDKTWWYYSICSNLAGAAVFIVNSELSVFVCIVSLMVLSSKSFNRENSILICLLFGAYSLVSSFIHWIIELRDKKNTSEKGEKQNNWKMAGSIALSILAVIVFFYLYRLSNPLFNNFTKFINFDWFSFGWLCCAFFGFLIMHGLLRSKRIEKIAEKEIAAKKDIPDPGTEPENNHQHTVLVALILFSMLNVMLLVINGLDIANIYITKKLPQGITLSDFVHQAVRSTVFSIVIAVSLIAWFFRGDLNFNKQGQKIKFLVYLWIFQSLMVVINTMIRNYWYIQEYQLTYLRIGVFVFLILCLCGLVLTYFKISKRKSAWGLVIRNTDVWFFLLIIASLVNWDRVITNYNIQHATSAKTLDKLYLICLSDANIPELIQLSKAVAFTEWEKQLMDEKVLRSYKKDRFTQWQSFNLRSHKNQEVIKLLKLK